MSIRDILNVISFVAGMVTEPLAITSVMRSQPPIGWASLVLIGIGSAVAVFIVLGFQGKIGNQQALYWGWNFWVFVISCV